MNESTRACIRGCKMGNRHLDDCDGETPSGKPCRGCLPRRATEGLLCGSCYRRFEMMLTDAATLHRWLSGNIEPGGQGMDEIGHGKIKQKRKGEGSPAPLRVPLLDVRDLLADRLAIWVDHHCEDSGVSGPGRHTPEADAKHLLRWLSSIAWWDIVADWWDELAEVFTDAHALAPWRPVAKRVPKVACPECEEVNLVIFGGESDVTCLTCRTVITERMFGLWELIVQGEQEAV